jgi:hypothetical protein
MGHAITSTMGFISQAFAAVADQGNVQAGGFFGSMLGIQKNKVAEGITSVEGAGNALKGIAEGLIGFQKLVRSGIKFGSPDKTGKFTDPDTLGFAVTSTLAFVNSAFASVADQGNVQASGFFGSVFGFDKNKVTEGIDSVEGAGTALTGIAQGLIAFQKLIKQDVIFGEVDPKTGKYPDKSLGQAITQTLLFVGSAFANIGGQEQSDGWWIFEWDENLVAKGIEATEGAGEALNGIADSLNKFQGLKEPIVTSKKINTIMTIVGAAFMKVNMIEDADEVMDLIDATADGYERIAEASNDMNIEAIATSARMFEALGYLSEKGGDSAMEELGESLVEAIHELAMLIADFEGTVGEAKESNASTISGFTSSLSGVMSSMNPFKGSSSTDVPDQIKPVSEGGQAITNTEVVAELKRLQMLLMSGEAIVQTQSNDIF